MSWHTLYSFRRSAHREFQDYYGFSLVHIAGLGLFALYEISPKSKQLRTCAWKSSRTHHRIGIGTGEIQPNAKTGQYTGTSDTSRMLKSGDGDCGPQHDYSEVGYFSNRSMLSLMKV